MGEYYLFDPHIERDIEYGPNKRNYLDIYYPPQQLQEGKEKKKKPVLVFFSGYVFIQVNYNLFLWWFVSNLYLDSILFYSEEHG